MRKLERTGGLQTQHEKDCKLHNNNKKLTKARAGFTSSFGLLSDLDKRLAGLSVAALLVRLGLSSAGFEDLLGLSVECKDFGLSESALLLRLSLSQDGASGSPDMTICRERTLLLSFLHPLTMITITR